MKVIQITIICLFFLIGIAQADTVRVSGFQAYPQEKSNWCWAASIQSIFLTRGLQVSQNRIVSAAYGAPINKTAPGFKGTLNILNGLTVGADGSLWKVSASAGNTYPNANWLYDKLNNDEPVMIWYKDEYTNHSVIVNGGRYFKDSFGGIQWQEIYVYDPWYKKNMTINATNIPKYVYGSFEITLQKSSTTPQPNLSQPSQMQYGSVCYVQGGACPLAQLLPVSSQCFCPSSFGPIYGIVGK